MYHKEGSFEHMDLKDYQAGQKEPQYEHASFLPKPICHEWVISDPQVSHRNSQADRALGELNAYAQLIPNVDFFISVYRAKEVAESSRIEGTQTNTEDVFKEAEDINPEARDDWAEVQNYVQATTHALARLETLPLSSRLLCETHRILMQGVRGEKKRPGEFRTSQNWIGGRDLKTAAFIPPNHNHIGRLMGDMENFLHDEKILLPPLIKIAIAHYQFETIHPFLDGNGRIGRFMISLYLASKKLLTKPLLAKPLLTKPLLIKPVLYLSAYFERNKTAYIDHLIAVREGNHMREWLLFFLDGVRESAQESVTVFKNIVHLKGQIESEILPQFGTRRQKNAQALMRFLYGKPVVSVGQVEQKLKISTTAASTLIKDFVDHELLFEITGQRRNRLFLFRPYTRLFGKSSS